MRYWTYSETLNGITTGYYVVAEDLAAARRMGATEDFEKHYTEIQALPNRPYGIRDDQQGVHFKRFGFWWTSELPNSVF
jgi:hypothetical protein